MRRYPLLDDPKVRRFIFFPRREAFVMFRIPGTRLVSVEVEEGIKIVCRFYITSKDSPSILFFHGNGEIAADYDDIAPHYLSRGINLFVADYRGYGLSGGEPTAEALVSDALAVFETFRELILKEGMSAQLFVMGRSLGSVPAIEIAHRRGEELCGLIIESGFSNTIRLLSYLGILDLDPSLEEEEGFGNGEKIRRIQIPTLIIHAERDTLIPISEAEELYRNSQSRRKEFLVIPGADHNDIMLRGGSLYFDKIAEFVKASSSK